MSSRFESCAESNIVLQYAWAHYAVAQGYSSLQQEERARQHVRRAEWWQSIVGE